MDIADFIRARLDEDERTARRAADDARGMGIAYDEPVHWRNSDGNLYLDGGYGSGIAVGGYGAMIGDDMADHLARWDPARVLAEIAAKRRILGWANSPALPPHESFYVLDAIARVWAEHPDFREDWEDTWQPKW